MKRKPLELYVHIPFCKKKCNYCDFLSAPASKPRRQEYLQALLMEIVIWSGAAYDDYEVKSIFIGGGTPTMLDAAQMNNLIAMLKIYFNVSNSAEITVECNPESVTKEKLEAFKQAGVNRLSFGLQSANNDELAILGRVHTWEQFLESFKLARECGFTNINVDLMSALPGQTLESWTDTLKKVAELNPEHISAYSLIIEEGTPFYARYGENEGKTPLLCGRPALVAPVAAADEDGVINEDGTIEARATESDSDGNVVAKATESDEAGADAVKGNGNASNETKADAAADLMANWPDLPDEDTERAMYAATEAILVGYGYDRYEISNYAKKNRECAHNVGYWTGIDYIGLGLGASSMFDGARFTNLRDIEIYKEAAKKTQLPTDWETVRQLTDERKIEEFMFLGLRMMRGVSRKEFERRFKRPMDELYGEVIAKYVDLGLMEEADGWVRLTKKGIDVSNVVLADFLLDVEDEEEEILLSEFDLEVQEELERALAEAEE